MQASHHNYGLDAHQTERLDDRTTHPAHTQGDAPSMFGASPTLGYAAGPRLVLIVDSDEHAHVLRPWLQSVPTIADYEPCQGTAFDHSPRFFRYPEPPEPLFSVEGEGRVRPALHPALHPARSLGQPAACRPRQHPPRAQRVWRRERRTGPREALPGRLGSPRAGIQRRVGRAAERQGNKHPRSDNGPALSAAFRVSSAERRGGIAFGSIIDVRHAPAPEDRGWRIRFVGPDSAGGIRTVSGHRPWRLCSTA